MALILVKQVALSFILHRKHLGRFPSAFGGHLISMNIEYYTCLRVGGCK
jgi:hypothetical protein